MEEKVNFTKQDLIDMTGIMYSAGHITDNPEGINVDNSGNTIKFVVQFGGGHDWAVYVGNMDSTYRDIASTGVKVSPEYLKNIIDVDEEVWKCYRW